MIARWLARVADAWTRARARRYRASAAGVRGVAAVLALVAVLLLPSHNTFVVVLAVITVAAASAVPATIGASPFLVLMLLAWAFGHGRGVQAPAGRTIAFALVLYAVHQTVALAAAVPLDAAVSRAAATRWARSSVPSLAAVPVTAAVVTLLGRPGGSAVWDVIGVGAGLAVLGCLVVTVRGRRV